MDSSFIYYKPVQGKFNIGRKSEQTKLSNMLSQGENVLIYEPPKTGKTSLLQQTFWNMRVSGNQFATAEVSMLSIRRTDDFLLSLGAALIRAEATTPDEFDTIVRECLPGTHFVFDPARYSDADEVLSLNWDVDENDIRSIFCLPYRLAAVRGKPYYVVLDEFQSICFLEGWEKILKIFEDVLQTSRDSVCAYVFLGSKINAMRHIFKEEGWFHRLVNHLQIENIDAREITDHIVRNFLTTGKVIDRDLMMNVCKRFRCNIWYINHFASICDHLTRGFITDATLEEALAMLISIHEPRFMDTVSDLTGFQASLLRATLEGCKRFSSAEVIDRYQLHSSANVRRLKDALCKKEILFFDEKDDPIVIDPLFEYWAGKYFFGIKGL
jgi:hypothetical protein